MKYTTEKISQDQYVGNVRIKAKGGDLNEKQVEAIKADPWGQELIKMGFLTISDGKGSGNSNANANAETGNGNKEKQEGK
jgi:hypothetical protein